MEVIIKCSDDCRGGKNIYGEPIVEIVRCQDCKYWVYNFNGCARNPCTEPWYATDFCNYGEREEVNDETTTV